MTRKKKDEIDNASVLCACGCGNPVCSKDQRTRFKIGHGFMGRHHNEDTRRRIASSNKGQAFHSSEEYRRKISIAQKSKYAGRGHLLGLRGKAGRALHKQIMSDYLQRLEKQGAHILFVDSEGHRRPDVIYAIERHVVALDLKVNGRHVIEGEWIL